MRKAITKLPYGWPTKGMLRHDMGEMIIIAHPERTPHLSFDGKTWEELKATDPKHNKTLFKFEMERFMK